MNLKQKYKNLIKRFRYWLIVKLGGSTPEIVSVCKTELPIIELQAQTTVDKYTQYLMAQRALSGNAEEYITKELASLITDEILKNQNCYRLMTNIDFEREVRRYVMKIKVVGVDSE